MTNQFINFLYKKPLVIWGYGNNGKKIVETLTKYGYPVKYIVDSSLEKQGQKISLVNTTIEICSPDILKQETSTFHVIVSPYENHRICAELECIGYKKAETYICCTLQDINNLIRFIEINSIAKICNDYVERKNCNVVYVFTPTIYDIKNSSVVENALKGYTYIINDRIEWLKGNPPHIKNAHDHLPHYSENYIKNIFTGGNSIRNGNGELIQEEHHSKYVNVINGMRLTTDIPNNPQKNIHIFGSSIAYGFGVEDRMTLPSCLQRVVNEQILGYYKVLNYGVRGLPLNEYPVKIKNAAILNDDIIICLIVGKASKEDKEVLEKYKCSIIELDDYFHRPHDYGEVFFDDCHFNYKGYFITANILYHRIFGNKNILKTNSASSSNFKISDITKKEELNQYLTMLKDRKMNLDKHAVIGSIVVNANPFSNGHHHLIKMASQMVDYLYIFVVEDNRSEFSFSERIELVRKGTLDIDNISIFPSGKFIISNLTFPEYFDKDNLTTTLINPSLDIDIFGKHIAKTLEISIRFVGEEPFDNITKQYNETMKTRLPLYGIKVLEIPRKKYNGEIISAKRIRTLMKTGKKEEIRKMVPASTYELILSKMNILEDSPL